MGPSAPDLAASAREPRLEPAPNRRGAVELAILGLGALFSAAGSALLGLPSSLHLLGFGYAVSWGLIEAFLRTPWAPVLRTSGATTWLSVLAAGLAMLLWSGPELSVYEGLHHVDTRLVDRAVARSELALDPSMLRSDRVQRLMLWAPDARAVSLSVGGRTHDGEPLGEGIFRFEVDPEAFPSEHQRELPAELDVDGARHSRTLSWIEVEARPRALSLSTDQLGACAVSEETDGVFVFDAMHAMVTLTTLDRPVGCHLSGDVLTVAHADGRWLRARLGDWSLDGERALAGPGEVVAVAGIEDGLLLLRRVPPREAEGLLSELVWIAADGAEQQLSLSGIGDALAPATALGRPVIAVTLRAPARLVVVALDDPLGILAERELLAPAAALATWGSDVFIATSDFSDDATPHRGNHFIDDQLVRLDALTLALEAILHTAGRSPAQDHAGDIDTGAGPRSLSVDGTGALIVGFAGTREVWRLPSFETPPERHPMRELEGGEGTLVPSSAVRTGDGSLLVTSSATGTIAVVDPGRRTLRLEVLGTSDAELLSADPEALRARMGELAFYEATRSGVSCESCHLFGGSDYIPHNIGGRLLSPTLDVRGVAGTAPYLRDGSYPRLSDLHEVAVEEYRGYRFPAGDRGATIEGYLSRTSRPTTFAHPAPSERITRGARVFVLSGCTDCHRPPTFTDLGLHAGIALFPEHAFPRTVVGLDTPSLRGVAESAPYLYDGRAPTLRAVFTTENRANRHGRTAALHDDDLDALIAFLGAL